MKGVANGKAGAKPWRDKWPDNSVVADYAIHAMEQIAAPIAQLVEHLIRNEGVFGSNPDWGTTFANQ